MRHITLGAPILWPSLCACCLKPPEGALVHKTSRSDHYLVVKATRTLELEVPYCLECIFHVQWYEDTPIWVKALLIFLISGLAGLLVGLALFLADPPRPVPGALAFAAPCALTAFFLRYKWSKRPPPLGDEHVSRGAAVYMGYFDKEQCRLLVLNDAFAEATIALNGGS